MKFLYVIFFSILLNFYAYPQESKTDELKNTILSKDSLLFNIGFNTCDISQFDKLLSDKFEFFHDKDSISYKKEFVYNLRNGLCIAPNKYQSRRELVKESTEVYPLYKNKSLYGAIQNGVHRFYETMAGQKERYASTARFTHVWLLAGKEWKLSKSLSYDHDINIPKPPKNTIFDNDAEIENWLATNKIPTLGLGILKEGKLQQVKVFGKLKNNEAAPYNTIFNVASLTKPVTAITALKLVSLGKWSLDEPLYKYYIDPEIALDARHKLLTTRIILSHQTGFPNWRWMDKNGKLAFTFTPGTKYNYSGEGMEYLRKALEKKFGKTLDLLANELIFKPLKMNETQFFWNKNSDESRFAQGYDTQGKIYEMVKNIKANAADDLLTTVEDYGNFLASILNGNGLSTKVLEDLTTNQAATTKGKHFGLGLEKYDLKNGEYALSHGGADKGVQTIFFIFPKTMDGLLIITNVDDGYKVYEKLMVHYLGEKGQEVFDIETK